MSVQQVAPGRRKYTKRAASSVSSSSASDSSSLDSDEEVKLTRTKSQLKKGPGNKRETKLDAKKDKGQTKEKKQRLRMTIFERKTLKLAFEQCGGKFTDEQQEALVKVTGLPKNKIYKWAWDQNNGRKDNIDVSGEKGRACNDDQDEELLQTICKDLNINMSGVAEQIVAQPSDLGTRRTIK